jgi:DNA-binding transcriptional LysR family regulator
MATHVESTLPNILAFCRTYELGNFTRAAKALQLTPAAVSRSVARLERALGVALFRRTTRELRVTAEGRRYYDKCAAAVALLAEAERDLAGAERGVRGLVRLSVPTTYGLAQLLPRLTGFGDKYPDVELEIQVSNQSIDFVREDFDLAIRMGVISDAGLVARKLGEFSVGVFASPRYLRQHGEPRAVEELAQHRCIAFMMPRTSLPLPWLFAAPNQQITVSSRLRCLEDPAAGVALAMAGEGLFQAYHFLAASALARGALVEVLRARAGRTRPFSLVYPRGRGRAAATRAVIEFVLASTPA